MTGAASAATGSRVLHRLPVVPAPARNLMGASAESARTLKRNRLSSSPEASVSCTSSRPVPGRSASNRSVIGPVASGASDTGSGGATRSGPSAVTVAWIWRC